MFLTILSDSVTVKCGRHAAVFSVIGKYGFPIAVLVSQCVACNLF